MPPTLSVLVPGLLGPPCDSVDRARWLQVATEAQDFSAIEKLLERAQAVDDAYADSSLEGMLCRAFSVQPGRGGDWPVGAACYESDGGSLDANALYLRADPVFVRPGLAEVSLRVADDIGITGEDAAALCAELNTHFAGRPARLESLDPARWYLRCDHDVLSGSAPPSLAAAGFVDDLFPVGDEARQWRGWLNEVQMVLHASRVNEVRVARGDLPVNSLWLWGAGGSLSQASEWRRVSGDDFLAQALARATGSRYQALPADLNAWSPHNPQEPGNELVVMTSLYIPALNRDIQSWREQMELLEANWFKGMLSRLAGCEFSSINFHPGFGRAYRATSRAQKRFWKRSRGLASLVELEVEGACE